MYPLTQNKIYLSLTEGIYPGANYAFIQHGTVFSYTLGSRQLVPEKLPLTANTLFDLASLTKVIGTTSLILKLVENKQLDLDTPLTTYLSEFTETKVTIRHLLTHTSAINSFIPQRDQLNKTELRQALLNLKAGPLIGEKVVYTDTGTLLLGFLIEKIYARPVQDVITTEVLLPLGMTESTFKPRTENIAPTENHPQRGLIKGVVHDPKASVLAETCGSAGLFSNLADCVTFCQMILAQGKTATGAEFFKPATVQNLFSDQTPTNNLNRSLGWDLKFSQAQRPLIFHTGYTGTFLLIDLEQQEAFIFLSNRVHPVDQRELYLKKRDELIGIYLAEHAENSLNLL